MQTLFVVFGVIVVFLLVLNLSILAGIHKTLVTYLMFTLRQSKISNERPQNEAVLKRKRG